ncbi:unnamed protein product [Cuscuta epithymum]|uniref:Uncharacterized protein n=1 Tax=Cuscuta epithymum TaxID=186058 RepID=A0AAV0DY01_9ASTE|nr:unnamed protein product [Cuscuta epithymum]
MREYNFSFGSFPRLEILIVYLFNTSVVHSLNHHIPSFSAKVFHHLLHSLLFLTNRKSASTCRLKAQPCRNRKVLSAYFHIHRGAAILQFDSSY